MTPALLPAAIVASVLVAPTRRATAVLSRVTAPVSRVTLAPVAEVIAHCAALPAGCADSQHSGYTVLALAVDVAMACDDAARARYAAIYGREWEPICEEYPSRRGNVDSESSREITVQA